MKDKYKNIILNGSVIDIKQTVNGQYLFVVLDTKELDVRYAYDISKKYEYDKLHLLDANTEDKTIEVIGNIHDLINRLL